MEFDLCKFQVNNVLVKAGKLIRQLKGLPEERDISKLCREAALLLGIPIEQTLFTSKEASVLPRAQDISNGKNNFYIPRKDCPVCKAEKSLILVSLCPTCKDAEGGKYHSAWRCDNKECMATIDKSEKFITQALKDLGQEVPTGTKEELGIKTLTDEGVK